MYWPGRARSLCRLKPYPLEPRWITQSLGLSLGHTSWTRTWDKGNRQTGVLIRAARRQAKTKALQKIPPPWVSAQREPEAQRLWRAPLSPWPSIWSPGWTCRWLLHAGEFYSLESKAAVRLHVTPNCFPGRKTGLRGMWLEVCWGKKTGGRFGEGDAHGCLEEGAGSAGVGDRCLLQAPRRTMGAGRWPPACLPVLPVPSSPALGWQEESELFCHPGKHWSSNREPPFLCVDEEVSLFSRGGLMSSSKASDRSYRRDWSG